MKSPTQLSSHRTVLTPTHRSPVTGNVMLRQFDDDAQRWSTIAQLTSEDYDDMGRPEFVTVTFEPGDLLNEEEA